MSDEMSIGEQRGGLDHQEEGTLKGASWGGERGNELTDTG